MHLDRGPVRTTRGSRRDALTNDGSNEEMAHMESSSDRYLAQGFRYFNRFMLAMWRLGLGSWVNLWPDVGGRIMVLTHIGRRTGIRRRTPVNYAIVDGEIYCTAGFGQTSDWYRNVMAHPDVQVWLPDSWWTGKAEEVAGADSRLPLMRQVLIASGFAAYAAGIDPRQMTDQELDAATAEYRLLRIRRTAPCTGPEGPGDLAWVWPLAVFVLLPIAWRRLKRT